MLQRARAKAADAGAAIDFRRMDMREFTLPDHRFGLILIAANSLLHLHKVEDLRSCLQAAGRQLAPGGVLVFDVWVPSVKMLARQPDERQLVGDFVHSTYGEVRLEDTMDYDRTAQVKAAGLKLVARFGGFERQPFDRHSQRQVCVCEVS